MKGSLRYQINQKGITSEKPYQMLSNCNVFLFKSLSFSYYREVKDSQLTSSHMYHFKAKIPRCSPDLTSLTFSPSRLNQNCLQVAECSDLSDTFIFLCPWWGEVLTIN